MAAHFTSAIDFDLSVASVDLTPSLVADGVISSLVAVHQSVESLTSAGHDTSKPRTYVTPRHFLDCIQHLGKLIKHRRSALNEQQSHLSIGLAKLKEAADEVTELQEVLRVKSALLKEKKAAVRHIILRVTVFERSLGRREADGAHVGQRGR